MKFKNLSVTEKPREKALKKGLDSLSNTELLAIFLRTGNKNNSVLILAQKFLEKIKGLKNLDKIKYQEIVQISGIGKAKALEILASFELIKRIKLIKVTKEKIKITKPEDIYKIMETEYENIELECFYVILLDRKNNFLEKKKLYQGTKNQILVDLKDIFTFVLTYKGEKMICVHNHPSGNANPSSEDLATTKEIKQLCYKLNLIFIDHIIIGEKEFYSLSLRKKYLT